jgi:hypothetical protein
MFCLNGGINLLEYILSENLLMLHVTYETWVTQVTQCDNLDV